MNLETGRSCTTRRLITRCVGAAVAFSLGAVQARAQRATSPVRESAFISGIVRDTAGVPVPSVTIDVTGAKQQTTTDGRGRFRVDGLQAGLVSLAVRRPGFTAILLDAELAPGENIVTIEIEPAAQQLRVVRTEATQTGLFGVVGDTAFDMVAGASVRAFVHGAYAETNAQGQFVIDPFPVGTDILDVRKLGFKPKTVTFNMPPTRGIKLVVWLTPLPAELSARDVERQSRPSNLLVQLMTDIGQRRRWTSKTTQRVATRDVLAARAPGAAMSDAMRFLPGFSGVHTADLACVVVDGFVELNRGFDGFIADEIEMLEVVPVAELPPAQAEQCGGSSSAMATSIDSGSYAGTRLGSRVKAPKISGSASIGSRATLAAVILLRH